MFAIPHFGLHTIFGLLLWVWLWSHPIVKMCFITNCFIHKYIHTSQWLYFTKVNCLQFCTGTKRHTHLHTHSLLFGSYDSCVCCDGVALSKCLINVQIPNATKSRQTKCNFTIKNECPCFAWVSDPFPFSILSSSRFIRTF